MASRPTHFEIPVDDAPRAERFYGTVFGWSFQSFEGAPEYYGMASTGDTTPGINGALFQRRPDSVVSLTMEVDSIEDTIPVIEAEGGSVLAGKTPIPGMGYFAVCTDTEGNRIGLFTGNPSAS